MKNFGVFPVSKARFFLTKVFTLGKNTYYEQHKNITWRKRDKHPQYK